ncbi:hypothetical protein AANUM_0207 [Aggregatibacter actinomycetemcomitans NUM4039]|nr:hypothetical protein AANUM_0207 [Aggregatibacter actinomycetemcomitans NUM4039]
MTGLSIDLTNKIPKIRLSIPKKKCIDEIENPKKMKRSPENKINHAFVFTDEDR